MSSGTIWSVGALLVSVALGVGAAGVVYTVVQRYSEELRHAQRVDAPLSHVVVTTHLVGPGTVLASADLKVVDLPAGVVPRGVPSELAVVLGRTALERLLPGEIVRSERLAPPDGGQGMSALIPEGMRAVSLDLAQAQRVSGFVEPGDGVDVIVTLPAEGADLPAETQTLLQAVRVLAVDERISETMRGEEIHRPTVTVAVTPAEGEKVTHAMELGQARLTLRSVVDLTHVETNGATVAELLGTPDQRLTVAEYRERVDGARLEHMIELVAGRQIREEEVDVDPRLLRPVPGGVPNGAH